MFPRWVGRVWQRDRDAEIGREVETGMTAVIADWQHRKKSFWWLEDENSRKTEDGVKMGRHEELGNEEEGYLFDEKLIKVGWRIK